MTELILLDGPMGTELEARGVSTELPRWSASALDDAPAIVAAIHRDYAAAGACVHTANTFRTRRRTVGDRWETLARRAVSLARASVPREHRVAGSLAPLEDCYRPDLSPPRSRVEHRELATVLADAGCDLLLCETFPHAGEARVVVEEAVRTGLPVWAGLTAGPGADLLTPEALARAGATLASAGAEVVFVNCTPARASLAYVEALRALVPRVGVYANAGAADDVIGWRSDPAMGASRYLAFARTWVEAGAEVIGGCCGTGPRHIAALRQLKNGDA